MRLAATLRRGLFLCTAGSALLLASCSGDSTVDERTNGSDVIGFGIKGAVTKGSATVTADVDSVGVFGFYTGTDAWATAGATATPDYFCDKLVEKNGAVWTYTPEKYWPVSTDKLSFFAYAPHSSTTNGVVVPSGADDEGVPTLAYTVDAAPSKHIDLLWAAPQYDKSRPVVATPVQLTMDHALTRISFSAAMKEQGVAGKYYKATVTEISINNVKTKGTLNLATGGWTLDEDLQTYDLLLSDGMLVNKEFDNNVPGDIFNDLVPGKNYTSITPANGYLMVLPQTLSDDIFLSITVEITGNITTTVTSSLQLNTTTAQWEPGQAINYQFQISGEFINTQTMITLWDMQSASGNVTQ